jgi:hypothetical protein
MRLTASQYAVRLTWGLGLLLLPAVQQKVCTRPVSPDGASQQSTRPGSEAASGERSDSKSKREPLTLAALVPDALVPRWPSHTQLTAAQRERPPAATTWVNGPDRADDESVESADAQVVFATGWSRIPAPQAAPADGNAGVRRVRACRHAFLSSILRTGPPSA